MLRLRAKNEDHRHNKEQPQMRVFVTGATGFIGSSVVQELIAAGHQVLGLARSEDAANSLAAAGAQVQRGDLADLQALRSGASAADAVIHTAFIHDFSKFQEVCEVDRQAIETLGAALADSNRPFLVSAGIGPRAQSRVATEDTDSLTDARMPRVSEQAALALQSKGVRVSVMRLPQVHDPLKAGLITYLIALAREKGVSAYVGDGSNRWAAVHRLDCANLYKLALEKGTAGARYHVVAEEGVPLRDIAESIGRGLKIPVVSKSPEEAPAHFGWLAFFASIDMPASGALTQKWLGWTPTGPSLISDLDQARYLET
jgi:nucleoside-diphosphate-sugar epimerase